MLSVPDNIIEALATNSKRTFLNYTKPYSTGTAIVV